MRFFQWGRLYFTILFLLQRNIMVIPSQNNYLYLTIVMRDYPTSESAKDIIVSFYWGIYLNVRNPKLNDRLNHRSAMENLEHEEPQVFRVFNH